MNTIPETSALGIATRLDDNARDFMLGRITYAEMDERQRALWDAAGDVDAVTGLLRAMGRPA